MTPVSQYHGSRRSGAGRNLLPWRIRSGGRAEFSLSAALCPTRCPTLRFAGDGGRALRSHFGCDEGGPPREAASVRWSQPQGGLRCRSIPGLTSAASVWIGRRWAPTERSSALVLVDVVQPAGRDLFVVGAVASRVTDHVELHFDNGDVIKTRPVVDHYAFAIPQSHLSKRTALRLRPRCGSSRSPRAATRHRLSQVIRNAHE
jgi:hypothetical protein